MKANQSLAGGKNSRAARPKQARKTTGANTPAGPGKSTPTKADRAECDRVSDQRRRAFEGRSGDGFDPAIPGVHCLEWCEGALLDRVCAAIYDAEPCLADLPVGGLDGARLLAHRVMEPVRVRGLRALENAPAATWRFALPGMQGEMCATDRGALRFVADALYECRHAIVEGVLPRLPYDRASALADALVIAETDCFREGTRIDAMWAEHWTPLQWCSVFLRERCLQVRALAAVNDCDELPSDVMAWAKGGAR